MKEKACCFTGYRPSKFSFPLKKGNREYDEFEKRLKYEISLLIDSGCFTFISGMAMGFDVIAAEQVIEFKKQDSRVKLVCVLPFASQGENFPMDWSKRYFEILKNADEVITLSEDYYSACYFVRNHYMVDNSDMVLTFYNGKGGGTAETLKYAEKRSKEIINLCD